MLLATVKTSMYTERSTKLFDGSVVTPLSSELAISAYILRHHWSKYTQDDLLQLINLHLPQGTSTPSSLFLFRKKFLSASIKCMPFYVSTVFHWFATGAAKSGPSLSK